MPETPEKDPKEPTTGPQDSSPAAPQEEVAVEGQPIGTSPAAPAPALASATEDPEVARAKAITKAKARDLRSLVSKYIHRHLPEPSAPAPSLTEPPRTVGAHARLLPLLRLVPVALLLLFGLSFLWDFPGRSLTLFGTTLPLDGLLRILAVSGLIGFLTNWLAITMLFNPRKPRPIFGQGLIPAQRERVIYRLAKAISEELINEQIIKQKIEESNVIPRYREMAFNITRGILEDEEFRSEFKGITADYVDSVLGSEDVRKRIVAFTAEKLEEHLGESLSGMALKAYRYFNERDFQERLDKIIQDLPRSLDTVLDEMDHLLDRLPEKLEARSDDIEGWATRVVLGFVEKLDVYQMIMANMANYDEQQLENLLKRTSNEQLNYIKYLGGILGALGGFILWQPLLALGVFSTIGLTLYGLDVALYRTRQPLQSADPTPPKP